MVSPVATVSQREQRAREHPVTERNRRGGRRLKREPRAAASKLALSRQAKTAAARRRKTKKAVGASPRSKAATRRKAG
jgi:hypothetical protein